MIFLKDYFSIISINGFYQMPIYNILPMTPYESMLSDEEVAAVVTYVRSSFGNNASAVDAETVARVRKEIEGKSGFYSPEELRAAHPE